MPVRCLLLAASLILGPGVPAFAAQPRVVRENIEWLDVWVPDVNAHGLPRVLLIGDSITRGYGPEVEQKLKGKAYVARLATSKSLGDPALLAEVALVLSETHFDVIHFNNGLHGWGYSEQEYAQAFPDLVRTLRQGAKGAKLIWATTTPVREAGQLDRISPRTERVKARNRIAGELAAREHIPVDDLYNLVEDHPEYYGKDGVHFNAQGIAAEATQVAGKILEVLK
jgi:lysophospholipase L1-like esterase